MYGAKLRAHKYKTDEIVVSLQNIKDSVSSTLYAMRAIPENVEIKDIDFHPLMDLDGSGEKMVILTVTTKKEVSPKVNG